MTLLGARSAAASPPAPRADISAHISMGATEDVSRRPIDGGRLFYFDQDDDPLGVGAGVGGAAGGWSWPRNTYLYVGSDWSGPASTISNRCIYHAGDLPEGVRLYFRVTDEYEQAVGPADGGDTWILMTDTPQLYDDEPAVVVPGQRNGAICQIAAFVEGGDWPDAMVKLPRIVWLYHIS